jgi:aryl-alcohol dehydrogenase-like predicted oxidoreductase
MEQIELATTGRRTTRLGFGCSSLMGATSRGDSLKLLETAYDAGIRHFDVAPMYGYGHAEACVGEFLERHPGELTVTTKFGIAPPRYSTLLKAARRIAGPIVRQVPSVKRKLAQAANAATRPAENPRFTASEAKASLDRSLRALRGAHIDLWLLHEAEAHDLTDDGLLALLESEVQHGTIGSFGVGTRANSIPALLAQRPAYCRTLQYEWSILAARIPTTQPFRIHHSALTNNFRALHKSLSSDQPLCRRWSESTNTDLSDADSLANLMLKAALVMNPTSIILVSSKNPHHIHANARIVADSTLEAPACQLYDLIQSEPNLIHNLQT